MSELKRQGSRRSKRVRNSTALAVDDDDTTAETTAALNAAATATAMSEAEKARGAAIQTQMQALLKDLGACNTRAHTHQSPSTFALISLVFFTCGVCRCV